RIASARERPVGILRWLRSRGPFPCRRHRDRNASHTCRRPLAPCPLYGTPERGLRRPARGPRRVSPPSPGARPSQPEPPRAPLRGRRSEEHTSELQSRGHLVCRLLLEKKKE